MTLIECACGCGTLIENPDKWGKHRKFIKGHHTRTEATRKKISETKKGENHPLYGKKHSEETRQKMSKSHKGRKFSESHRKNMSEAQKGKKNHRFGKTVSYEIRCKLSEAMKGKNCGKTHSIETRLKISKSKKGTNGGDENPFYNKKHTKEDIVKIGNASRNRKHSKETRNQISNTLKGKYGGINHPNWQGGKSFEPYCLKFNKSFKKSIREQFNNECFICGITQDEQMNRMKSEGKRAFKLCIHHVDYNKDCLCDNIQCEFIPLCLSCHSKTNYNREHWEQIISEKIRNRLEFPRLV